MPQPQIYKEILVITQNSSLRTSENGDNAAVASSNAYGGAGGSTASTALPASAYTYTAADIQALIRLAGLSKTMLPVYNAVANLTAGAVAELPANVKGVCLHGESIPTPIRYTFAKGLLDGAPVVASTLKGDGQQDDVTNLACNHWGACNSSKIICKGYPGADHDTLLSNYDALATLIAALAQGG